MPRAWRVVLIGSLAVVGACGKKGAPLAPLRLVPAAPTALEARRAGDEARLHFVLPPGNLNGGGPSVLDRAQIYAVTLAPGMAAPPNRELLTPAYLVGTVAVKPPPVEDEPAAADAPPDPRPSAGDPVTFVEPLGAAQLEATAAPTGKGGKGADPATRARAAAASLVTAALATVPAASASAVTAAVTGAMPGSGPAAVAASFAVAASAAVTAAIPTHAVRIYAVQGMTKKGRAGQPSTRVELPLVPAPPAPGAVLATVTETMIAVTWTGEADAAAAGREFNVYTRDGQSPLNAAPLAAPPFERPGVTWGTEECFVVRAVEKVGAAAIESEPSPPACVTPRDTFPPAAPKAVSIVAGTGTINLSWDASTEADLGGYLVLRGEAAGGPLVPLTPAPVAATNYEDTAVRPGVRYVYTIVAVDKATPPNQSAPSDRVEETAR
ncbi:MAG: fibronectin type III domain-containing protein [Acidobacteriota bacterium]